MAFVGTPVDRTLALGVRDDGYAFEAEIVLRASRARWLIAEVPITVVYPPGARSSSHFRLPRDPARIVARVVHTVLTNRTAG